MQFLTEITYIFMVTLLLPLNWDPFVSIPINLSQTFNSCAAFCSMNEPQFSHFPTDEHLIFNFAITMCLSQFGRLKHNAVNWAA